MKKEEKYPVNEQGILILPCLDLPRLARHDAYLVLFTTTYVSHILAITINPDVNRLAQTSYQLQSLSCSSTKNFGRLPRQEPQPPKFFQKNHKEKERHHYRFCWRGIFIIFVLYVGNQTMNEGNKRLCRLPASHTLLAQARVTLPRQRKGGRKIQQNFVQANKTSSTLISCRSACQHVTHCLSS